MDRKRLYSLSLSPPPPAAPEVARMGWREDIRIRGTCPCLGAEDAEPLKKKQDLGLINYIFATTHECVPRFSRRPREMSPSQDRRQ